MATRYALTSEGTFGCCCGDGRLLAIGATDQLTLAHVVRGAPLWRVRLGADGSRVSWLSEGFAEERLEGIWAPSECSWLVQAAASEEEQPASSIASATSSLIVFHTVEQAEAFAEAVGVVEPAWAAEGAAAILNGAQAAARGVRGAAEAIVHGVRWSRAAYIDSVDACDQSTAAAPVDPGVLAAVSAARDVAAVVAGVGEQVVYTVAGAAFVAGRGVAQTAESAGVLEALDTPSGRAARHVTTSGLLAACGVFSEVGSSLSNVWNESARAVTEAVQHTSGDEAAHIAAQALEAGGSVGAAVTGLVPTVVARKAVFAGVLGAAGLEVGAPQQTRAVDTPPAAIVHSSEAADSAGAAVRPLPASETETETAARENETEQADISEDTWTLLQPSTSAEADSPPSSYASGGGPLADGALEAQQQQPPAGPDVRWLAVD